jgi:phage-related holin
MDITTLFGNKLFIVLAILIMVNLIAGIIAAIKQKIFTFSKIPDFMTKGVLIMVFILIVEYMYDAFTASNLGSFAVGSMEVLRVAAWVSTATYYLSKIYTNFRVLGMPRVKEIEEHLKSDTNEEEK